MTVQFVDYGNTDRVSPSELRKNIIMEYVPIQALLCELYHIVPVSTHCRSRPCSVNYTTSCRSVPTADPGPALCSATADPGPAL